MHPLHNHPRASKPRRQRLILDLITKGGVPNQERLADLLRERGLPVTQATLSRDLHELGVVKGPAGYSLPDRANGTNGTPPNLERATLSRDLPELGVVKGPAGYPLPDRATGTTGTPPNLERATLSRDLHELGVVKGPAGYSLPD